MVLVFDIEGDMALFRKPYTTTSMVSYPFPPPTAVAGMLGAIVGINHEASQNAKNARYWGQNEGRPDRHSHAESSALDQYSR